MNDTVVKPDSMLRSVIKHDWALPHIRARWHGSSYFPAARGKSHVKVKRTHKEDKWNQFAQA